MAYTLDQYEELKAAIAGGELSVRHGDRSITYRSIDDMLRIRSLMEAELFPETSGTNGGRRLTSFSKGY